MNLPNKLTVLRVMLVPVFLVFYFIPVIPHNFLIALIVFAVASITDMLDGMIARKRKLITDFGKLMDPLADKLLVMSALICLLQDGILQTICLILIMAREFLVTAVRQLAAGKNKVIPADIWGKLKTVSQMLWIIVALAYMELVHGVGIAASSIEWMGILLWTMLGVMVTLTVLSGVHYLLENKELFADA